MNHVRHQPAEVATVVGGYQNGRRGTLSAMSDIHADAQAGVNFTPLIEGSKTIVGDGGTRRNGAGAGGVLWSRGLRGVGR